MLYRVTKRPDCLSGLVACIFTGAASVSIIVGERWGQFHRTGPLAGVFVISPAAEAFAREDLDIEPIRPETTEDDAFLDATEGKPWRPWHNCFSVMRDRWTKTRNG